MPLCSFFFWFGFVFAKEELLPSLSQSSPYPHHVLPSPEGSNIPFFLSSLQSRASLSSLEAFPWLWNPSSYRVSFLSFLIWFLPPRHHSDGTGLMAALQPLKPPGLAWSPGPCLIPPHKALNMWSCPAPLKLPLASVTLQDLWLLSWLLNASLIPQVVSRSPSPKWAWFFPPHSLPQESYLFHIFDYHFYVRILNSVLPWTHHFPSLQAGVFQLVGRGFWRGIGLAFIVQHPGNNYELLSSAQ